MALRDVLPRAAAKPLRASPEPAKLALPGAHPESPCAAHHSLRARANRTPPNNNSSSKRRPSLSPSPSPRSSLSASPRSPRSPQLPTHQGSPGARTRGPRQAAQDSPPRRALRRREGEPDCVHRTHLSPLPAIRPANSAWTFPASVRFRTVADLAAHFDVVEEVGVGGFAVVYHAVHRDTLRECAIKVISSTGLPCMYKRMLEKEVAVLDKFRWHPNVLRLEEVVATENNLVIVTEFMRGGDLLDHLNSPQWGGEAAARDLFWQLTHAVEGLHAEGYLHRDLKPENIFLKHHDPRPNRLKLGDFGLCVRCDQRSLLRSSAGTVQYNAPEVLSKEEYGLPSDIWSLGVVLFAMLGNSLPFHAATASELRRAKLRMEGRRWEGVSQEAKELVRAMLDKDPAARPDIRQVRAHPWFRDKLAEATARSRSHPHNAELGLPVVSRTCAKRARSFGACEPARPKAFSGSVLGRVRRRHSCPELACRWRFSPKHRPTRTHTSPFRVAKDRARGAAGSPSSPDASHRIPSTWWREQVGTPSKNQLLREQGRALRGSSVSPAANRRCIPPPSTHHSDESK